MPVQAAQAREELEARAAPHPLLPDLLFNAPAILSPPAASISNFLIERENLAHFPTDSKRF